MRWFHSVLICVHNLIQWAWVQATLMIAQKASKNPDWRHSFKRIRHFVIWSVCINCAHLLKLPWISVAKSSFQSMKKWQSISQTRICFFWKRLLLPNTAWIEMTSDVTKITAFVSIVWKRSSMISKSFEVNDKWFTSKGKCKF